MGRAEKRAAFKRASGNPDAIYCPICGRRTMHVAVKVPNDIDHYTVHCEVCGMSAGRGRLGYDGITGKPEYVRGREWKKTISEEALK